MDSKIEIALKGLEFKRVLEKSFDTIKKNYKLKKVDIEVLMYLSICGDSNTPTDIHRNLSLNRGHVSQAIDSLCKKGYIGASIDCNDRRVAHYQITEASQQILSEIESIKNMLDKQIFKGLSEAEILEYKRLSSKIMENINDI